MRCMVEITLFPASVPLFYNNEAVTAQSAQKLVPLSCSFQKPNNILKKKKKKKTHCQVSGYWDAVSRIIWENHCQFCSGKIKQIVCMREFQSKLHIYFQNSDLATCFHFLFFERIWNWIFLKHQSSSHGKHQSFVKLPCTPLHTLSSFFWGVFF